MRFALFVGLFLVGFAAPALADGDSKTSKPAKLDTKEHTIYDGLWGYYIKRQLCANPGTDNEAEVFFTHPYQKKWYLCSVKNK